MPVYASVETPDTAIVESSVELLREFERTGRPEPFEVFMRRHASMVYATCLKVTRDPHDAEDATQATFLTLASKSRLNGEIRQPEAWLRKVAHRLSLDLIRSKKRRVNRENLRSEMNAEAAPLDSHDHADKGEIKGILNEELAKLPASYRMPLILHYFGGLSRDEMAEQLKLKPSTLGVRLHRAREQLRRKLAARGILLPSVALTALLTDVVHQSVCGHMMSSTARQASAIALGHASPPMFAASTGVDSIGSLLNVLAHGKFKVLFSALIVGMAISMTSAQVRSLIPAAIRSIVPSWRMPSFSVPRIQLTAPMPRLSAVATEQATPQSNRSLYAQASTPAEFALVRSFVSSVGSVEQANFASSSFIGGLRPLVKAPETPATPFAAKTLAPAAPQTFAFASASRMTTAEALAAKSSLSLTSTVSSGASRDDDGGALAAARPPAVSGDLWNGVIADAGSGGGGGGSMPPARLPQNYAPAVLPGDAPARVTAPVTGAAPALRDSTGRVAGNAPKPTDSPAQASTTDSKAAAQSVSARSTLKTAQTVIFNGTGVNHGGYASDAWKPTELNHVTSLDQSLGQMSDTASTPPGYSFNYPSVPGTTIGLNGARATLHAAAGLADAPASISFVDTSSTKIPSLPKDHHFIGVWQLDVSSSYDTLDLLVHYDDLRAQRLGLNERILKLWVSDGKSWTLLWRDPSFGRDIDQNLMWVTAGSGVKFFAASAPEPATLAVTLGAIAIAAHRRRR